MLPSTRNRWRETVACPTAFTHLNGTLTHFDVARMCNWQCIQQLSRFNFQLKSYLFTQPFQWPFAGPVCFRCCHWNGSEQILWAQMRVATFVQSFAAFFDTVALFFGCIIMMMMKMLNNNQFWNVCRSLRSLMRLKITWCLASSTTITTSLTRQLMEVKFHCRLASNCSKYCSTSGHRYQEILAWSVLADAWRPALAGYSSASAVQSCCDSPLLSSPLSSTVPRRILCASLRRLLASAICQMSSSVSSRKFAAALLGPVHFLSPDQQSGIHCLIICTISCWHRTI